jgi:DNA end-binding protein Ku
LHQVWQPAPVDEEEVEVPVRGGDRERSARPDPHPFRADASPDGDPGPAATRITLRPHDPETGEEIDKREVVKGYEYGRGQVVTFTPAELKALDIPSSKIIDLEKFVPHGEIDPVYLDSPYYLYPDGPVAVETLRVIGAAMAEAGLVGIGRLTLSRRERAVMVEPRGTGMTLFTVRAAEEVRTAQFEKPEDDVDPEMVAIAGAIMTQRTGAFDPGTFRDRYQEALRELIEAKMEGLTVKAREIAEPPLVVDLMAALKRSLVQDAPGPERRAKTKQAKKKVTDRRQAALLLPVAGGQERHPKAAAEPATPAASRRKRA